MTGIQISRPKRVLLAKPRGYCAGVDRAVVTVEEALRRHGAPIYVRKQIVHNSYVVRSLEQRGVVFVSEVDEVPTGARVVFSAHGVAPSVHAAATVRELKTLDATCPLVSKVHTEARRFAAAGYEILLVGHRDHEEVEGIVGEAPEHVQVVESPEEAAALHVSNPDRLVWLSQTTLSVDETLRIVDVLRERFPKLASPPSDDICYASQNRQTAIKSFAAECDLVLVVGSENSSNSKRLVEVALEAGAKAAYLVDHAAQVDETWLTGVQTLGVTSGASVPELLVQELLDWLSPHGFSRVDEVTVAQERLTFALPRELRTPA